MTNDQIVYVNDTNFQYEVLSFSQNSPVIVEFIADWCRDCRIFYPKLEKMIIEDYPYIRLAKINVDENPNTTLRYSVRSLPSVKAFSYARIVDQVTGIVPEKRLGEMLSRISMFGQNTLVLEKALNFFEDQNYAIAEKELRAFLVNTPDSEEALLGLSKSLLAQQKYAPAVSILDHFPVSKLSDAANQLSVFTHLMLQYQEDKISVLKPLDATFLRTLKLVEMENYEAALDGLLDILRNDKNFRQGIAKTLVLALLELLPESKLDIRKYRMELSLVLF